MLAVQVIATNLQFSVLARASWSALNPTGPSVNSQAGYRVLDHLWFLLPSCFMFSPPASHFMPQQNGTAFTLACSCLYVRTGTQSTWLFASPMNCSLPGSSVLGILQGRTLEWVASSSSRGSSRPRDRTCISCIGRRVLYPWATWKAPHAFISRAHSMSSARTDLPWRFHPIIALFSSTQLRSFVPMKLFLLAPHPQAERYFWFFMTQCEYVYHSCETSLCDLSFSSLPLSHPLDCRLPEGSHDLCIPSAFPQCFMMVCGMNE